MKILVSGASGKLGAYLLRCGAQLALDMVGCSRSAPRQDWGVPVELFDLTGRSPLDKLNPDVILHTAALSAIAECYQNPGLADQVNHQVTRQLAEWCASRGRRLIYVSTDMVFDGERSPYAESAPVQPLSEYGRSKQRGEDAALTYESTLVARIALMVGPALGQGRSNYDQLVTNLRSGTSVSLFEDEWRSMISYEDAAKALLGLCSVNANGIIHLGGPRLSRLELGQQLAEKLKVPQLVRASVRADYPSPEPRPRDLTLADTRMSVLLPSWSPRSLGHQIDEWLT